MSLDGPKLSVAQYWPSEYSSMIVQYLCENPYLAEAKRVADLGTGSGILAATALELGAKEVVATDIDFDALEVANATLRGAVTAGSWHLFKGQMWDALDRDTIAPFDLVVANLPNFPAATIEHDTRPVHWSVAGETGRLALDPFLADLTKWLRPGAVGLFTQNRCIGLSQSLELLRQDGLIAEVVKRCYVPIGTQKIAALSQGVSDANGIVTVSGFVFLEVCLVLVRTPLRDLHDGESD